MAPASVATATTLFVVLELTQKLSTEPKMQQLDGLSGTSHNMPRRTLTVAQRFGHATAPQLLF